MTQCVTTYSRQIFKASTIFAAKNSDIKQNCGGFVKKAKFKIILSFVFLFFFADVFAAPIVQAFFSPNGKITTELIKRIASSKKNIFGAVYTFTDATVAQALVDACKRGVDVRIVVDRSTIESQWGKAKILIDGGVNVFCKLSDKPVLVSKALEESFPDHTDQKLREIDLASIATPRAFNNFGPIMHHKYAIFDDKTVWTGSFNWTLSANNKNSENVVVIDQMPEIVVEFNNNFKTSEYA